MNYSEITALALNYADKTTHTETSNAIDDFLRIVEARVNRFLKTSDMAVQATLTTSDDKFYYGLPTDFAGLRGDPSVPGSNNSTKTFKYMTPERMNGLSHLANSLREAYYTIEANQLRIFPDQDSKVLTITYYQKLTAIDNATNTTNWLTDSHPDAYVFGLLVEIFSFNKDAPAKEIWDARFKETLELIRADDQETRWSGNTLETRLG